jgi:hypothetical protein
MRLKFCRCPHHDAGTKAGNGASVSEAQTGMIAGSCLCGQVAFQVWGPFARFVLCHCSRCRKATAAAHAANLFTGPDHIQWLRGRDLIRRYQIPEARSFSKCFCTHCGSALPYVSRNGEHLIVPAGVLDGDPGVVPERQIFWDSRACWYEAGLAAPRFAEYPPAAG